MIKSKIINDSISVNIEDLADCFKTFLAHFKEEFEKMDLDEAIRGRSNSFREALRNATYVIPELKWETKLRDGSAPFQIDAKYNCGGKCGSQHLINLVVCLNNREAIGTNFLKLEVAALGDLRNSKIENFVDENTLGILISLDSDLLIAGNWDNSYADSSEYTSAFRKYYRQIIKANIVQLRIHKI